MHTWSFTSLLHSYNGAGVKKIHLQHLFPLLRLIYIFFLLLSFHLFSFYLFHFSSYFTPSNYSYRHPYFFPNHPLPSKFQYHIIFYYIHSNSCPPYITYFKVNPSHYRPKVPIAFQEVTVLRLHDSGPGWWQVLSLTHLPLLTPRKYSWNSFLLEPESTPGPQCDRKNYVNEKFQ